jgi:hypothetical protein
MWRRHWHVLLPLGSALVVLAAVLIHHAATSGSQDAVQPAENYYDDGTEAGRMRADVASTCSSKFGEALAVSVRQMEDTDNNWYFALYSGQAGAGIALVNEDTGAIQCRRS